MSCFKEDNCTIHRTFCKNFIPIGSTEVPNTWCTVQIEKVAWNCISRKTYFKCRNESSPVWQRYVFQDDLFYYENLGVVVSYSMWLLWTPHAKCNGKQPGDSFQGTLDNPLFLVLNGHLEPFRGDFNLPPV